MGTKSGDDYAIWLKGLIGKKDRNFDSALVFMIKNLFEQHVTLYGRDHELLTALTKSPELISVRKQKSALFSGDLIFELEQLNEKASARN